VNSPYKLIFFYHGTITSIMQCCPYLLPPREYHEVNYKLQNKTDILMNLKKIV
jgi:hypothetical protein